MVVAAIVVVVVGTVVPDDVDVVVDVVAVDVVARVDAGVSIGSSPGVNTSSAAPSVSLDPAPGIAMVAAESPSPTRSPLASHATTSIPTATTAHPGFGIRMTAT